jgi:hypothetical protein
MVSRKIESRKDEVSQEMKIAFFDNYSEACLAANQLKEKNVNTLDVNTSNHVSIAGAEQFYYIEVPSEDVENAKTALVEMGYKQHII